MFKEIQSISNKIIELDSQINKSILSTKNLRTLKNCLTSIELIKQNINHLLDEISLIPKTSAAEILKLLIKINQSIIQLNKSIEKIYQLMDKLVFNYRDRWESMHKNNNFKK